MIRTKGWFLRRADERIYCAKHPESPGIWIGHAGKNSDFLFSLQAEMGCRYYDRPRRK